MARAKEEMHYYKLELQNREENYNQLFGQKAMSKAGGGKGRRRARAWRGLRPRGGGGVGPATPLGGDRHPRTW